MQVDYYIEIGIEGLVYDLLYMIYLCWIDGVVGCGFYVVVLGDWDLEVFVIFINDILNYCLGGFWCVL